MKTEKLIMVKNYRFNYNAAFLYYNLKGIVAEKWGHEYFNRFNDLFQNLLLENRDAKRNCIYGLKNAELFFQDLSVDELNKDIPRTKELIQDIIKSLEIVKFTHINAKTFYLYEFDPSINLFKLINEKFCSVDSNFFPEISTYYDLGLAFEFNINKYIYNFMFGPISDNDRQVMFRFPTNINLDNYLVLNYSTYIKNENIDNDIGRQIEQINNIIDSNHENGLAQLEKIIDILEIE